MSARTQTLLWTAQRATAAALALFVVVHLGVIIYAVRNGLTAAEILGRTQGNAGWAAFYGLFVLAVAVHAPIGLRSVLTETLGWRGRGRDFALVLFGLLLLAWGLRAVWAVTGAAS
jgi:fumarate reductase subunit C